jgi:hypothetical protein
MDDITALILDDHHAFRRGFARLDDAKGTEALRAVWEPLATYLEIHAEAEEAILYPHLLKRGDPANAEEETEDAIRDHNKIRDAVAAVGKHAVGTPGWFAAVAAANKENGDHMAEEEREGLTDFRRTAALPWRHDLAVAFATFEAVHFTGVRAVQKDPKAYVAEHAP